MEKHELDAKKTPASLQAHNVDSIEHRTDAHQAILDVLQRTHFESNNTEKKVAWLKRTSFKAFMSHLAYLNGKILGLKRQKWRNESAASRVNIIGDSDETLALDPPKDSHTEFKKLYKEMQIKIDETNYKAWAMKLYLGIVFGHIFKDGNGRTARYVYALLSGTEDPSKETIAQRPAEIDYYCEMIGNNATLNLFKSARILGEDAGIDKIYPYVANESGFVGLGGAMNHLRYLAAKEALSETLRGTEKVIALSELSPEQREAYEVRYKKLRTKRYHELFKIVDKHEQWLIRKWDDMLLKAE